MRTDKTLTVERTLNATGTIVGEDGRSLLVELISRLGAGLDTVTGRQLTDLAEQLTQVAGSGKTEGRSWSRSYLVHVLHGTQAPSPRLTAACAGLLREWQGESALLTRSHPVMVMAAGDVEPNAVVLANSKKCARIGCQIRIVPVVPWQKFCPDCKKRRR